MNERELFRQVALNFAMGAALGAVFVTSLLVLNVQNIADVILRSASPAITMVILVIGGSVYFAFGAAITGFQFVFMEENRSRDDRR